MLKYSYRDRLNVKQEGEKERKRHNQDGIRINKKRIKPDFSFDDL